MKENKKEKNQASDDRYDVGHQEKVIIAGFGGQGVMLAGKLIIHCGLIQSARVTYIPSYGAEVRGGTAHCHVILSRTEVASPIIEEPDFCLVMNGPSQVKFTPRLRPGGILLVNSSLVTEDPSREDVRVIKVPAGAIAEGLGNIKAANMVMLGAYAACSEFVSLPDIKSVVTELLPLRHRDLLEVNLQALSEGHGLVCG